VRTLTAALLVLLPALGGALDWNGSAGLLYSRTDIWPTAGARVGNPHTDLDLRLDLRGDIGGPGIFAWSAGGGYRRIADSVGGRQAAKSDAYAYRIRAGLFQNRTTPFKLQLYADRTDSKLENLVGSNTLPGDSTVTRYGTQALFRAADVPTVQTGYERVEVDETIPGALARSRDSHLANFAFGHSAGGASINMRFNGDWTTGSWTADNYDQYVVTAEANSLVTAAGNLFFTDQYTHRTPTAATGPTYAFDLNAFTGGFRAGMRPGEMLSTFYRTVHSVVAAGAVTTETTSHSGRHEQDVRLGESSKFFLRPLADVTYFDRKVGATSITTSGETVRCLLWWRDASDRRLLEWNAGPAVGLLQVPGESQRTGYGAAAAVRYSGPALGYRGTASYEVDWRSDIFGQRGWTLRQQGLAGLSGSLAAGSYTAQLQLTTFRGWSPLAGDYGQRNLQLSGIYRQRSYGADINIALASGTAAAVSGVDTIGDGLFLPKGFDAHTLTAWIGGDAEIVRNLRGRLQLRATNSSAPGQPDVSYVDVGAAITYRYGAFDLSLEDRYTRAIDDPDLIPANVFMFRVARSFGTNY
jgi:hypothetical protein